MIRRLINSGGPGSHRRNHDSVRLSSALVHVTGATLDSDMVRLACELLEPRRGVLHILYVIEVPRDTPVDAVIADSVRVGEEVLEQMEEVADRYNGAVQAEIIQARQAGAAVVEEAVDREVQAIVIGASTSNLYGTYSFDTRASYILRHAPCRVILTRDSLDATPGISSHQSNAFGSGV